VSSYDLDGSSTTKEGVEKVGIRQIIREEIRTYLQDPLGFPEEYKGWLPEWIGQAGIDIPIGQVIGYSQNLPQNATTIATAESIVSGSAFKDLATVGPELTGLADGQYQISWGAVFDHGGGGNNYMGVKVNATEAVDDDSIFWNLAAGTFVPGARTIVKTLDAGGNNTITCRYKSAAGEAAARFRYRWMTATRIANA
jgi:hypothetical protein